MGRFVTGARLAATSWRLMWRSPRLWVFPAISTILMLLAVAVLVSTNGGWDAFSGGHRLGLFLRSLVLIFPMTLASTALGVAFASQINVALDGGTPSLRAGLRVAWQRRDAIAWWSLLAATVGALIALVRHIPGGDWLLGLVARGLEVMWALATLLVVPVLALEGDGARTALRRSVHIFRQRWREEASGTVVALAAGLTTLPGVVLLCIGGPWWWSGSAAGAVLMVIGAVLTVSAMVFATGVDQFFRVILYRYAADVPLPPQFSAAQVQSAVTPRKRWWGRRTKASD